jgi:hypothetical protein
MVLNFHFDRLFPWKRMDQNFGVNPSMDADCCHCGRLHASGLLPVAAKGSQGQLIVGQMAPANPLSIGKK